MLTIFHMVTQARPVRDFMSLVPHCTTPDSTVVDAEASMRSLGIGHLPIVDGAELVGVLSAADARAARAAGCDLRALSVRTLMAPHRCEAKPDEELTRVARHMAEQHADCAVVREGGRVVGILTTTDALRLLADALVSSTNLVAPTRLPESIRQRLTEEHAALSRILHAIEALAERALRDEPVEADLRARANELYRTLLEHMDLEDVLLVPALEQAPTAGPHRATEMLDKHEEQRQQLQMGRSMLESGDTEHLAESLLLLAHSVRLDMKQEEQTVLSHRALSDSLAQSDVSAG